MASRHVHRQHVLDGPGATHAPVEAGEPRRHEQDQGGRAQDPAATEQSTRSAILEAAKHVLLGSGYAGLSTRKIAEIAGVPLSQIHYHFGSKQGLVLSLLNHENQRLVARQRGMYSAEVPLSKRYDQACDLLEEDLASGYVRVLQEMVAAGWSDPEL